MSFEICLYDLPADCIELCSASGPVDDAVEFWVKQPVIVELFQNIDKEEIRNTLKRYGAWDENELKDDEQNKCRILWLACGEFADCSKNPDKEGCEIFVIE